MVGDRFEACSSAVVVPCRLASERFPRKLLHPVAGRPLVVWTAERVSRVLPEVPLWFAVDGPELADVLGHWGYRTLETDPDLCSGTDRIAAANREIGARIVVNVQADEPLVSGDALRGLIAAIREGSDMATLAIPFMTAADFLDPNQVKVLVDRDGFARYFSRAPIPYRRGASLPPDDAWVRRVQARRHVGVYAYRADFLEAYQQLPESVWEAAERLEQLRALEAGKRIRVLDTDGRMIGVDAPEDVGVLEAVLREEGLVR